MMRFLGGKYGLAVVVAIWITVVTPWLAFSQQTPDYDMGDIELLTAEEVGLPPYYWAYLQHSWEWSQLYDPVKARTALTESITRNEPHALRNLAKEVYHRNTCETLELPSNNPVLQRAFDSAERADLPLYAILWWACFRPEISFNHNFIAALNQAFDDPYGLPPVLRLAFLDDILTLEGAELIPNRVFMRSAKYEWVGNFFLQYHFAALVDSHAEKISSDTLGELAGFLNKNKHNTRYHRLIRKNNIQKIEINRENYSDYINALRKAYGNRRATFERMAASPSHFCSIRARTRVAMEICLQRAPLDQLSCGPLLVADQIKARDLFATCRKKFLQLHNTELE